MLYFAYGSNMDEQRVQEANRCPSARFIFNAVLPRHRLVFTQGPEAGTCAADTVADSAALVWGVVYDITDSDRQQLDAREGIGVRPHRPREVIVHPHGDVEQRVMVLTYGTGNPSDMQLQPDRPYLEHIISGARHWGIPVDYIAQLERTAALA